MKSLLLFSKDVNFRNFYNGTPSVFVSADHSSKGKNLSPVHNGITAWIEVRSLIQNCVCDAYSSKRRHSKTLLQYGYLLAA